MCLIELELQLEGAIGQATPLAQEGNDLIHDRHKVHRFSSRQWLVYLHRSAWAFSWRAGLQPGSRSHAGAWRSQQRLLHNRS